MAESHYYLVDCEVTRKECGKRFGGAVANEIPVNDSALARSILNSTADLVVDAGIRKKAVERAVPTVDPTRNDPPVSLTSGCFVNSHAGEQRSHA